MASDLPSHLVFVDFENVPNVDLDAIAGLPVFVTLLIGNKQPKVATRLLEQAHRHHAKVKPILVGASGRNALDLVLAHYLGRAVIEAPQAELHIVSKDKDFEPLIAQLRAEQVKVSRSDAFDELPFLRRIKPSPPPKHPVPSVAKIAPRTSVSPANEKLELLIQRMKTNARHRPKRRSSLLHHINTVCGNHLTDAEVAGLLDQLVARGVCKIDPNDRVTY